MGLRRLQLLSRQGSPSWMRKISPVHVRSGRTGPHPGRRRLRRRQRRARQSDAAGILPCRSRPHQEAWRGSEYEGGSWRDCGKMQVFGWLRPSVFVATRPIAVLRRRSIRSWASSLAVNVGAVPDRRPVQRGHRVLAQHLRSARAPASASTPSTCSTPAPRTSSQGAGGAVDRAVRQPASAGCSPICSAPTTCGRAR